MGRGNFYLDDEYVKLTPEDREQRQQILEACQRLSYAIEALSRSVIRKQEAKNNSPLGGYDDRSD